MRSFAKAGRRRTGIGLAFRGRDLGDGVAGAWRRGFLALATIALAIGRPFPAAAQSFDLAPNQLAVGQVEIYVTRYEDTLLDVARRYDLGYTQLIAADRGVDPWLPGAGRRIVIPNFYILPDVPRRGIVINLALQRLFYFPPDGRSVQTFPIGVGVEGRGTPLGVTRVTGKEVHPAWVPTPSILAEDPALPKVVPPGPDNPLGDYALALGWPSYLIHGTNQPYGVGRMVSHGCIRLYPEDIARLFAEVPVGTPVRVIDQAVQVAWIGGGLYVTVFPDAAQAAALESGRRVMPAIPPDLVQQVIEAAGARSGEIDWRTLTRAGTERRGVPVRLTPALGARRGDQGPGVARDLAGARRSP